MSSADSRTHKSTYNALAALIHGALTYSQVCHPDATDKSPDTPETPIVSFLGVITLSGLGASQGAITAPDTLNLPLCLQRAYMNGPTGGVAGGYGL